MAPAGHRPLVVCVTLVSLSTIRFGGAWNILPSHPRWDGFYTCRHGHVYGPVTGDGIDRHAPVWTVHLWRTGTKEKVVTRGVGTAYFVGTRH